MIRAPSMIGKNNGMSAWLRKKLQKPSIIRDYPYTMWAHFLEILTPIP